MMARMAALRDSAFINRAMKRGWKNLALMRAARASSAWMSWRTLSTYVSPTRCPSRHGVSSDVSGLQREVDALAGDWIDQSRGVPDQEPAGPGGPLALERFQAEGRDRPAVASKGAALPELPDDPLPCRLLKLRGARLVRLRADPDREMIGPRKGPEVTGRIVLERDDDLARRSTVDEVSAGDRQIGPAKGWATVRRTRLFAPSAPTIHDAANCPVRLSTVHASRIASDPCDALGQEMRPGGGGRVHQRAVEFAAAGDDERWISGLVGEQVDARRAVLMRNVAPVIADRVERPWIERCADQFQRAARDAAAARFLPRMTAIGKGDARAGTREALSGPRAGRAGTTTRTSSPRGILPRLETTDRSQS